MSVSRKISSATKIFKHDYNKPLSEDDLEQIQQIFRSSSTYRKSEKDGEEYISSAEIPEFLDAIDYHKSVEQLAEYAAFWNKYYDGKIPLSKLIEGFRVLHETPQVSKVVASLYDTNRDGIISETEFKEFVHLMATHEPKLKEFTFARFVKEADTNKDGVVSLEEFSKWAEYNLKV